MLVNQIVGSITSGPRAVFAVFNTSDDSSPLFRRESMRLPSAFCLHDPLWLAYMQNAFRLCLHIVR